MREVARLEGRPPAELNREFVLQRFLARVFEEPDSPWVLKGGTGLLVRLPRARHSDDVDLLYPTADIDLARPLAELATTASRPHQGDFLRFELGRVEERTATSAEKAVATIRMTAFFGAAEYTRFPIDLSVKNRPLAAVERLRPRPVVHLPGLPDLPLFSLYPLADQIADKICAMYEVHRAGAASTRHHDLVDLVLIVMGSPAIDARSTGEALRAEAGYRSLVLRGPMLPPGPQWAAGYRAEARKAGLTPELQDLDAALALVGSCLNPLLSSTVRTGTWNPTTRCWG